METDVIRALVAHRREIRANWETLLRLERPSSPLAHPDALVHLLDRSLDEIFTDMILWSPRVHPRPGVPDCACGRNPWLAYLAAGRQALREALIIVQAATPGLTDGARDTGLACMEQVLDYIARREIASFCAICQIRPKVRAHPTPASEAQHAHHHS